MHTKRIALIFFGGLFLAGLYGCKPGEQTSKASVSAAPAMQQAASGHAARAVSSQADSMKLAKDTGCFACHSIDKKLLGPAWKHVAGIYRNDPAAEDKLMKKIAKGGSGVWGNIEMPAYPDLGDEKRRALVKFILSLE